MTPPVPPTPYFIMGCRRSGTTLVSQIVDSHSRLASYHESYFYNILRPELRWYGDLANEGRLRDFIADVRAVIRSQNYPPPDAEQLRRATRTPTFEGVLAAVLELYAAEQGKARGGDKTPEHHLYLDEILRGFPGSPVVFLMRDPRDVAHSIRRTMDVTLEDGARAWNAALLSWRRARALVHLLKYEDLVTSPAAVVRALCEHLGETYEDGMLEFFARVPGRLTNRRGGELLDKPLDASAVGGYRRHLSPSEIATVETLCADGMDEMGYAFADAPPARRVPLTTARVKPSLPALIVERLRYYGRNTERWRRGMIRWRMMARVRLRWLRHAAARVMARE